MFGFKRKRMPSEVASKLIAWSMVISNEDCRDRLPGDPSLELIWQWWIESRMLVASGVLNGARMGMARGPKSDELQQAIYVSFVKDILDDKVALVVKQHLATRAAQYAVLFGDVAAKRRDMPNAEFALGAKLAEFVTGTDAFDAGDPMSKVMACAAILAAGAPDEVELSMIPAAAPSAVYPLLALRAFTASMMVVSETRWA